jgi:hypothetical protein
MYTSTEELVHHPIDIRGMKFATEGCGGLKVGPSTQKTTNVEEIVWNNGDARVTVREITKTVEELDQSQHRTRTGLDGELAITAMSLAAV